MQFRKSMLLITISVCIFIFGSSTGFCADVAKIGTFSFKKVLDKSAAGKALKNKIYNEGRTMKANLKKLNDEIKELKDMLEQDKKAKVKVMDQKAREKTEWELGRKIDEAKALSKRYRIKIQEIQSKLMQGLQKDLLAIITDFGKKEGYHLILEDIYVVYAPESKDITDKIIQLYDAKYSKKNK